MSRAAMEKHWFAFLTVQPFKNCRNYLEKTTAVGSDNIFY